MQEHSGTPNAPIWLLGDSEPAGWREVLTEPLDPRHPTRHSIWTPVWDQVQERLFVELNARLARSSLYIRNTVRDPADKPRPSSRVWPIDPSRSQAMAMLTAAIEHHHPLLILTLGHFAFEFCRRVMGEKPDQPVAHWTVGRLGEEYQTRVALPTPTSPLLLPLLHATIARGKYLVAHTRFCGQRAEQAPNYFELVGTTLADWIITRRNDFALRGAFLASKSAD